MVFLDKPRGWTSRKAVNEVVRLLGGGRRIKAGHTGTLDPLATGMLPILLGEATRFADLGLSAEKLYRTVIDLSRQTDTLDDDGRVTFEAQPASPPTETEVDRVLQGFVGSIEQVPPAFSAVRLKGKRAHELARNGARPRLKPRPVEIHEIRRMAYDWPFLTLEVRCGKGTYIRALARDIGLALGTGGCVVELRRLSTGGWPADCMVTIEELARRKSECVLPLRTWLRDLDPVFLDDSRARRFVLGQRLRLTGTVGERTIRVVVLPERDPEDVLGTARIQPLATGGFRLEPERVLPSAQQRWGKRSG